MRSRCLCCNQRPACNAKNPAENNDNAIKAQSMRDTTQAADPTAHPLSKGDEAPANSSSPDAALRVLESLDLWLTQTSAGRPEPRELDAIKASLDLAMESLWHTTCRGAAHASDIVLTERAEATAHALLQFSADHARCCESVSRRLDSMQAALHLAAHCALWTMRWTLRAYRKPGLGLLHTLSRMHALLCQTQARQSEADSAPDLDHAITCLARCALLAASDTQKLTPSDLHALDTLLTIETACTGLALVNTVLSSEQTVVLDPASGCIRLSKGQKGTPLLHVPLASLIDSLAQQEACALDDGHLIRRHLQSSLSFFGDAADGHHSIPPFQQRPIGTAPHSKSKSAPMSFGRLTLGFFSILQTEHRYIPSPDSKAKANALACSISDYHDHVRVELSVPGLPALPGQLVALERNGVADKQLAAVRWIERSGDTRVVLGLEAMAGSYTIDVLHSHDEIWPQTGLRVQQGIITGLSPSSRGTVDQIEIFTARLPRQLYSPRVPHTITLADCAQSFVYSGRKTCDHGFTRLIYQPSPRSSKTPSLR